MGEGEERVWECEKRGEGMGRMQNTKREKEAGSTSTQKQEVKRGRKFWYTETGSRKRQEVLVHRNRK